MSKRFFRHRELHVVLLALLAERPMHGYELMGELAERFGPTYRPSAGSVYPALESLAAEGLIEPDASSRSATYVLTYMLTTAGELALTQRSPDLMRLANRTGVVLATVAPVEAALARVIETARSAARAVDGAEVVRLLCETTRRLDSLTNKEIS